MIVDSSAIVAIIGDEADADKLLASLDLSTTPLAMSSANYLEAGIAVDGKRFQGQGSRLDELISEMNVELVAVTAEQAKLARRAYRQFGKGSGHPAQLNFGDCFAYALAIDRNEPLLFKGDDFAQTDVRQP